MMSWLLAEIWQDLMRGTNADYADDLGEIDDIGDNSIHDFLPPPDQLLRREDTVKVTLALSRTSVEFFKLHAERQGVPYQRMIRALIDEYAKRHV